MECPVRLCEITGQIKDTNYLIAPAHSKFILIDMAFDKCIIRFDIFSRNKILKSSFNYENEDYMTYKYFVISKAQFDFKSRQIFKKSISFYMGTAIIPVKFRINPFDFSKDVSIGTTVGAKFVLNTQKNIAINTLIGIGGSSNTLDSLNTHGHVQQPTDIITFTPTAGVMLEFGSAQLGVFCGFDFPSQFVRDTYHWQYADRPWFSIAIGYSIFSVGAKKF